MVTTVLVCSEHLLNVLTHAVLPRTLRGRTVAFISQMRKLRHDALVSRLGCTARRSQGGLGIETRTRLGNQESALRVFPALKMSGSPCFFPGPSPLWSWPCSASRAGLPLAASPLISRLLLLSLSLLLFLLSSRAFLPTVTQRALSWRESLFSVTPAWSGLAETRPAGHRASSTLQGGTCGRRLQARGCEIQRSVDRPPPAHSRPAPLSSRDVWLGGGWL